MSGGEWDRSGTEKGQNTDGNGERQNCRVRQPGASTPSDAVCGLGGSSHPTTLVEPSETLRAALGGSKVAGLVLAVGVALALSNRTQSGHCADTTPPRSQRRKRRG